jgi:hypothetical protein
MPMIDSTYPEGASTEAGRAHARLADQLQFMREQRIVAFGWMGFTVALAVLAPLAIGGTDTLAYLLICFACTLSLPTAFVIAWRRSASFREQVLAIDLGPVILLETGRILGLAMLILYAHHELNGVFAFEGGGLDVFIGASALTIAYAVLPMRPFPTRLFVGWNLLGLFDFVLGWTLIFLFSPTVAGVLAGDGPTTEAFVKFPMSFIPMFGVPFTACLHLIALMQVRHLGVPRVRPLFHSPVETATVPPPSAASVPRPKSMA